VHWAPGFPCALCLSRRERFLQNSGASRRGNAEVYLKLERRHCEERSDEAIHSFFARLHGLRRFARNDGVKARTTPQSSSPGLTGRSSIPETSVIEPTSRGVLDTPLARGMTAVGRGEHLNFVVIARSAATKQSIFFFARRDGLLRFARNDGLRIGCSKIESEKCDRRSCATPQLSSPGLTGRSSIPETSVIEPRSRGVLDTPLARGMTAVGGGEDLVSAVPDKRAQRARSGTHNHECWRCATLGPQFYPQQTLVVMGPRVRGDDKIGHGLK
jgi:hypothetical protein